MLPVNQDSVDDGDNDNDDVKIRELLSETCALLAKSTPGQYSILYDLQMERRTSFKL
jgi:hypothetical protein